MSADYLAALRALVDAVETNWSDDELEESYCNMTEALNGARLIIEAADLAAAREAYIARMAKRAGNTIEEQREVERLADAEFSEVTS
jgi:nitrate/nitrite-specific signal transduction histidine kinase